MSESSEVQPQKPIRKRESRSDANLLVRALRKCLKQVIDPKTGETPADKVAENLVKIAGADVSTLSMQAIRAAIDLCGANTAALPKNKRNDVQDSRWAPLRPTAEEEEAMTDEELDAHLAELQARLASIPTDEN
jgi:hypothetical protein